MSIHKDAKTMARYLREALAGRNVSFSHSECLEIVARQLGFADWNTLSAKLSAEEGRSGPSPGPDTVLPTAVSARGLSLVTKGVPVTYPEVDEASPMTGASAPEQWSCSFCGKSKVRSLIEGRCSRDQGAPRSCVFICDECVTFSAQVNADLIGKAPPRQEQDGSTV